MNKAPVTIVIPARYESSRFPGKPLAQLAGKPLIQHVYEMAIRVKNVDQVIVATDDSRCLLYTSDAADEEYRVDLV